MDRYKFYKFDSKTSEGTITRGAVYTEKPSFNYLESLKSKNKTQEIKKLKVIRNELSISLRINKMDLVIDELKFRILTSKKIALRYNKEFKSRNLIPAIVEEMSDELNTEVEIEYI